MFSLIYETMFLMNLWVEGLFPQAIDVGQVTHALLLLQWGSRPCVLQAVRLSPKRSSQHHNVQYVGDHPLSHVGDTAVIVYVWSLIFSLANLYSLCVTEDAL